MSGRKLPSLLFKRRSKIEQEALKKLRYICSYAYRKSRFYHRLWKSELGGAPRIRSLEDLSKLPVVDHKALIGANAYEVLACPKEKIMYTFFSGGTTGKPKMMFFTKRDWEAWTWYKARCNMIRGITGDDVVQIMLPFGTWVAGFSELDACIRLGATVIPTGMWRRGLPYAVEMMYKMGVTVLATTPSLALMVGEAISREYDNPPPSLRIVATAGEDVPDGLRKRLHELFDAEVASLYAASEAVIGAECEVHDGYHYLADDLIVEVLGKDDEPLGEDEVGEIAITKLYGEATPIIRYKLGDVVKISTEKCSCGLEYPRVWFIGRTSSFVVTSGVNVFFYQINEALKSLSFPVYKYQVVLREEEPGQDVMIFRLETEDSDSSKAEEALRALSRMSIDLEDAVFHGFIKLKVELVPPGSLPVRGRTGKAPLFIDMRRFPR